MSGPTIGCILLYWHSITKTAKVQLAILPSSALDPAPGVRKGVPHRSYGFSIRQELTIPQDWHHDQGRRRPSLQLVAYWHALSIRQKHSFYESHSHVSVVCAARLRSEVDVLVCVCSWSWLTAPTCWAGRCLWPRLAAQCATRTSRHWRRVVGRGAVREESCERPSWPWGSSSWCKTLCSMICAVRLTQIRVRC